MCAGYTRKDVDKRPFCLNCGRNVGYKVVSARDSIEWKGVMYNFINLEAHCCRCEAEIYVPLINDLNVEAIEHAVNSREPVTEEEDLDGF